MTYLELKTHLALLGFEQINNNYYAIDRVGIHIHSNNTRPDLISIYKLNKFVTHPGTYAEAVTTISELLKDSNDG